MIVVMDQPTVVTRSVDLDMSPDELWWFLSDPDGWAGWMVDESRVAVQPGGSGTVTDDGVERDVLITEVVEHESVAFEWWPHGDEGAASTVELIVAPSDGGAVLRVVETFPAPRRLAAVNATVAWGIRATCLWAGSRSFVAA